MTFNNYFTVFLIKFMLVSNLSCYAQTNDSIIVEKRACGDQKNYKLFVHLKNSNNALSSNSLYDLKGFTELSDAVKLRIVEKLLNYENDTSKCCLPVSGYLHNYIEGCKGSPRSNYYTLQVDALFMINRICFSKLTDLYSCHPVLYDRLEKKEINTNPNLIKLVFSNYRKWFLESKAKGKISKYFPFNDGRYVWYGGKKSMYSKDE